MRRIHKSILTRRAALKLASASASLAACSPSGPKQQKHVAVIGGGIIGASIAYHLASEGVKVSLLERGDLAQRASRGTFAWINATWAKQPRNYHQFNQAGLLGWKKLQKDLDIPVRWGGSLEWFGSKDRQTRLNAQIAEQVDWGEPAEMISRIAAQKLEPNVDFMGTDRVAFSPNDGAVDPVLATQTLVMAAQAMGAVVKTNCIVTGVSNITEKLVTLNTSCGDLLVDQYVLATGGDPEALKTLAGVDIPQRSTPGVIALTKPHENLINRIIVAPGVHIHQRDDGRIVLGEQDGAPQNQAHVVRLQGRPNRFPDDIYADQHASRILGIAEQYVAGIRNAEIEDVYIGWRPLPLDGHPVLGISSVNPKAYIAIMHSGVTLAPIVGALVAKEISTGHSSAQIDEYRPDRSFENVKRY